jgi:hypothetical protein
MTSLHPLLTHPGVNSKNVAYIANAIHDCVTTVKA